jgi:excisionase family DNA binding protein
MTYLVTEQVAERLQCSTRSVRELTRLGKIPHRRIAGMRRCLYPEAELSAWLDGAELESVDSPTGRVVRPKAAP